MGDSIRGGAAGRPNSQGIGGVGARGSKAVRFLAVVLASLLCACSQPPDQPPLDDESDIYRCYLNKDGTLLICPEKVKPTKVAGG
jgi:hypothetical protein